jgi:hypothetical protein
LLEGASINFAKGLVDIRYLRKGFNFICAGRDACAKG